MASSVVLPLSVLATPFALENVNLTQKQQVALFNGGFSVYDPQDVLNRIYEYSPECKDACCDVYDEDGWNDRLDELGSMNESSFWETVVAHRQIVHGVDCDVQEVCAIVVVEENKCSFHQHDRDMLFFVVGDMLRVNKDAKIDTCTNCLCYLKRMSEIRQKQGYMSDLDDHLALVAVEIPSIKSPKKRKSKKKNVKVGFENLQALRQIPNLLFSILPQDIMNVIVEHFENAPPLIDIEGKTSVDGTCGVGTLDPTELYPGMQKYGAFMLMISKLYSIAPNMFQHAGEKSTFEIVGTYKGQIFSLYDWKHEYNLSIGGRRDTINGQYKTLLDTEGLKTHLIEMIDSAQSKPFSARGYYSQVYEWGVVENVKAGWSNIKIPGRCGKKHRKEELYCSKMICKRHVHQK